jgi:uncharacterized protein YcfJ
MKGKFTKIAVAVGVSGALILPASAANAASKTERALIGALIGGVAGAAVSNGDTSGVALGAVAGAALGAATAKDKRYHSSYRTSRPYAYSNRAYGNQYRTYDRGYAYDRGYSRDRGYRTGYPANYGYYGR